MTTWKSLVSVIILLTGLAGVTSTSAAPIAIAISVTYFFDPPPDSGQSIFLRVNPLDIGIKFDPDPVIIIETKSETKTPFDIAPASAGSDYTDTKDKIDKFEEWMSVVLSISARICHPELDQQDPCGLDASSSVFAFAEITPNPDLPSDAPLIPIGQATVGSTSNSGPLYAFDSPGTLVGRWEAQITTSVPEPGTLALLGLGLAGLAVWRRRRQ